MNRQPDPGDLLAAGRVGAIGWDIWIADRHGRSGTPPVSLCGELRIPAYTSGPLSLAYRACLVVLGEELGPYWGYHAGGYRFMRVTREGDSMRPVLKALVAELTSAAISVDEVAAWNRRFAAARG